MAYPTPEVTARATPVEVDRRAAVAGEQQDADRGEGRRLRPPRAQPLAVDQAPEHAGRGGAGADGDHRADGDAGEPDGGEEGQLVDGDGARHGESGALTRGMRTRSAARHEHEQEPAEDDPRGADGDRRAGRADRLRGAGRAEADGGEEDLETRGHCGIVEQSCRTVKRAASRSARAAS